MSWLNHLVRGWVAEAVEDTIRARIPEIVAARLPAMIEDFLGKRFEAEPSLSLTPVGFSWAFFLAMKRRWPSVTRGETDIWGQEYLDAPFGADGFEWTPATAEELARAYAQDFGEAS